jgi:rRNA maturation RNase YbeY
MQTEIHFFKEGVTFRLKGKELLQEWIARVIRKEKRKAGTINFIFCSDPYLKKMNRQYLQHESNTDVITFDNSENGLVSGDIFISTDRVTFNAKQYGTAFDEELHRVMIHGILHLLGYDDRTEKQEKEIRRKEDEYLAVRTTGSR